MRWRVSCLPDVTKDLMLGVLNRIGTGGGGRYVIEYRGEAAH
ncbi:MAG: 3-isopropylmalate dehydratase large subunit [uncultured Rubrobacteraceae bacterium]|uniref:3-isopropylmalate dehydratase large subunit n=1 Tax=uncultured Rubrobacteraceae bacterium TaxID=349277 RepID=A0A6J4RDJ2_9ACTN|nr:MAG: 3-isopropylmalate dehydratase large subunit [uncultured Rubrobacteraceae bacterium]